MADNFYNSNMRQYPYTPDTEERKPFNGYTPAGVNVEAEQYPNDYMNGGAPNSYSQGYADSFSSSPSAYNGYAPQTAASQYGTNDYSAPATGYEQSYGYKPTNDFGAYSPATGYGDYQNNAAYPQSGAYNPAPAYEEPFVPYSPKLDEQPAYTPYVPSTPAYEPPKYDFSDSYTPSAASESTSTSRYSFELPSSFETPSYTAEPKEETSVPQYEPSYNYAEPQQPEPQFGAQQYSAPYGGYTNNQTENSFTRTFAPERPSAATTYEPSYSQPQYEESQYQPPQQEQPRYEQPHYQPPQQEQPQYEQPHYQPPQQEQSQYEQPHYQPPQQAQPQYEQPKYEQPQPIELSPEEPERQSVPEVIDEQFEAAPAQEEKAAVPQFAGFASFSPQITEETVENKIETANQESNAPEDSFPDISNAFSEFQKTTDEQDEQTPFKPSEDETVAKAIERVANGFGQTVDEPQNTEEVFKIAEEMSRSVLANSYNRIFTDNNLAPERKTLCLKATGLSAEYYLLKNGGQPYLMYDNVTVSVRDGSCTALVSDVKLASYALSKAIGELADYQSENIETSETEDGYDREILYIGSDAMLPLDMTCMDYLLFSLRNVEFCDEEDDPEEVLGILISQLGMGDIAELNTKELSHNKRIMLMAVSAALNPYIGCLIINDPEFKVTHSDDMIARRVFAKLVKEGKGILLSSCSDHLMSVVANRVIAIRSGQIVYDGSYKGFLDKYCLGIMSFTSSSPDETVEFFVKNHPNVSAMTNGNLVYLLRKHEGDINLEVLLKDAIRHGADHRSIVLDEKSFEIASKEALRGI